MFVQAGFLTSVKAAAGLVGGMVVSAPVYAALVGAAPIGLAVAAGAGIYGGAMTLRDKGEKLKFSAFLADILIAALPIAWTDGHFLQKNGILSKNYYSTPHSIKRMSNIFLMQWSGKRALMKF
jgi:hypothetical protein